MRSLTLVLPYYDNAGMLKEHQRIWATFPEDLQRHLHVIVVDDGSPHAPAHAAVNGVAAELGSFQLFRVGVDVRWNWLTCRNIGAFHAKTEWLLLTDIDHVLPERTLDKLLTIPLDEDTVYRLSRIDAYKPWPYALEDCPIREKKKFHPNTWLLTRQMYDDVGGYDERFSGCYGTDYDFRDRVHKTAKAVVTLNNQVLVRYPREVLPDASTTVFTRKGDPVNDADLRQRRINRDTIEGWKPLRLTFPYQQLL